MTQGRLYTGFVVNGHILRGFSATTCYLHFWPKWVFSITLICEAPRTLYSNRKWWNMVYWISQTLMQQKYCMAVFSKWPKCRLHVVVLNPCLILPEAIIFLGQNNHRITFAYFHMLIYTMCATYATTMGRRQSRHVCQW